MQESRGGASTWPRWALHTLNEPTAGRDGRMLKTTPNANTHLHRRDEVTQETQEKGKFRKGEATKAGKVKLPLGS